MSCRIASIPSLHASRAHVSSFCSHVQSIRWRFTPIRQNDRLKIERISTSRRILCPLPLVPSAVRALTVCSICLYGYLPVDSFRPPFRVKTTYLLYATTIAGYFVGGAVGNILYGNPNKKQTTKTTVKH